MPETAATRETAKPRRNSLLWVGGTIIIIAVLSNALFFVNVPDRHLLPWLNLLLFVLPPIVIGAGLKRARVHPEVYRGKMAGWLLMVLSAVLLVFSIFGLYVSHNLPDASGAPKVSQIAPDFTLPDSNGKATSLSGLLSAPLAAGGPPKAVLLVFYRGYW
ncbi:MAG: peroxiredoxin family protein [Candidatus Angelobacter sp.]